MSTRGGAVTDLRVAVQGAAGASSLMLAGTGAKGDLPKGLTFAVAGDATTYTLSSAAAAAGGSLSVSFTPVLAQIAAVGAVVTFASSVDYPNLPALRGRLMEQDVARGFSGDATRLEIAAEALGSVVPERGDLVEFGGRIEAVLDVLRIGPNNTAVRFDLIVGEVRRGA
jgi:hypothetical protein